MVPNRTNLTNTWKQSEDLPRKLLSNLGYRLGLSLLAMRLSILPAYPATYTAASVALSDVSVAVAKAVDGDTVQIPFGSATWPSKLTISRAITLFGSGTNSTIINGIGGTLVTVALAADKPVRVSGIFFNQTSGTTVSSLLLSGRNSAGNGVPITAFRIDHCRFNFGMRAVNPNGWCYGVVDHNTFVNCNIAIGLAGDNSASWNRPIEPGTTNCVCIEDNVFTINNGAPSEPNQQIYHQEGARSATRYNTFDGTSYTAGNSIFYDSHGNWLISGTDWLQYRGQPLLEVYKNVFHAHHTYQFSDFRGGTFFVFDNALIYDTGGAPNAFQLTEEESWQTAIFSPIRTTWPALDQVKSSFFWGNTLNGAAITKVAFSNPNDTVFIQENRDYWMHEPTAITPYFGYQPLVYPHPRIVAEDGGQVATPPDAPKNLKVQQSSL